MGANLTPIDKSMTREKAIKQGGYYNTDGDWNNVLTLDEYPGKIFRGRVEVLILKDGKLFMFLKENGRYRVPGGGFDKGVLNKDQAFIETKEEAKLIIENIRYTGVTYSYLYDEIWGNSKNAILYDGTYNEVYIAEYKGDYSGYIRKGLSDMELTNKGKFYDISEVEHILKDAHKQALHNMITNVVKESFEDNLDLIVDVATKFQKQIDGLHNIFDVYHCIWNRDMEAGEGGVIFAEYNTSTKEEISDLKSFVMYCNAEIKKTLFNGYVQEPETYKGQGFLVIKITE